MVPHPATKGTSMAIIPTTDPCKAADTSRLRYVPNSGFETALFDARNGYYEVNGYLMLWTVAHCWTKASWFAFNRYHHQNIVSATGLVNPSSQFYPGRALPRDAASP
jgi:hypothetical protein